MPADTKNIKRDRGGAPIPQVFDPAKDEYTPAIGTDGRQHAILHDEAGAPIDLAGLLGDVITAVTGTVTTSNSYELRGLIGTRPAANSVAPGTTFWAADRIGQLDELTMSDGAGWVNV